MTRFLQLFTPAFVDNVQGVIGDIVRFIWPTKADNITQIIGSVLSAALTVLAVLAAS